MLVRLIAPLLIALSFGCFNVSAQGVACGEDGLCPAGLECIEGECRPPGTIVERDAAVPDTMQSEPDAMVPLGPFPAPTRIAELDDGQAEDDPSVTDDLLELYYNRNNLDVYVSVRANVGDPWGTPTDLTVLGDAEGPYVLSDGLTIYFSRGGDILQSTRASRLDPWEPPVALGAPINTGSSELGPCVTPDDTVMIFPSDRDGIHHLYRSSRATALDPWGTPELISGVLGADGQERDCWVAADESVLYFGSDRLGGAGPVNIWLATGDGAGAYSAVQEAPGVNVADVVRADPFLSPDQRTIFHASEVVGVGNDADLFTSTR